MNIHIASFRKRIGLLLCLGMGVNASFAAPPVVGKISFVRGGNAAQQPGAAARILGQDTEIFQGDNIQTTERSFVIITFNDGAKVTVRPNSSFTVDHYDTKSSRPQARLTLHEGGVHASSGDIAKQMPESFQLKTPLATVTAQQADFSVRLCGQDCAKESQAPATDTDTAKKDPDKNQSAVARVVDIKGQVVAKNPDGKNAQERQLALGAPLYSADVLRSQKNSYALMVFRDGEKITLQPDSEMAIAEYRYQKAGQPDHALYRLTIGGMRALTGSIGKTNKAAYAIDTPVGTIGIRGTGFDLTCVGTCVNPDANRPDDIARGQAEGLYSHVWQGQIVLKNDQGEQLITMPESGYIANRQADVFPLPEIPVVIPDNFVPRPDKDNSSLEKLFGKQAQKGTPSGLYVAVDKGHVQLKQESPTANASNNGGVNVGKDETAYVDPHTGTTRLIAEQDFQSNDPFTFTDGGDNTFNFGQGDPAGVNADATVYDCNP